MHIGLRQVSQLLQRDRAAGWVSFGQKWKRIFCRQSIFNHCDVIGLQLKLYGIRWNIAKKLCSRLSSSEVQFYAENCRLGVTYDVHLRLISKRIVDFLFVLTELFMLGVKAEALPLRANVDWKSSFSLQQGHFGPKFEIEGVALTCQKTRINILSYCIRMWAVGTSFFRFVTINAFDRRTFYSWLRRPWIDAAR